MKFVREPYPSDLTDAQWEHTRELLPAPKHLGRNRSTDLREVLNAINYRWETGAVWRNLPKGFPPWATIYTYYRQWEKDGLLDALREAIQTATSPAKPPREVIPPAKHALNPARNRNPSPPTNTPTAVAGRNNLDCIGSSPSRARREERRIASHLPQ